MNHYYEPLFDERQIKQPLSDDRGLPGIDWNVDEQLEILDSFDFNEELNDVPTSKLDDWTFYMNNDSFQSGDAEYWYSLIRLKQPMKKATGKKKIEAVAGKSPAPGKKRKVASG
jgi:hypothetical protein